MLEKVIIRFISTWCLVSSIFYLFSEGNYGQIAYIQNIPVLYYSISLIVIFVLLMFLNKPLADYYTLFCFSLVYSILTLFYHYEFYYGMGILLLMAFLIAYLVKDDKLRVNQFKPSNKWTITLIILFGLFTALFIGVLTTLRYLSYNNSTYDFGIFSQMFYSMKKAFLPLVTCERDKLLSHFAVHISPIFYLILPIYMLFPSPITLEIMQALIVASGIVPVYLLSRHYKLSNRLIIIICLAYSIYPALVGGTFYDIHENKFLTPLILWLFYFFEKNKIIGVYSFTILVLMVKEDAALYAALISLYFIVGRKYYKHGSILFFLSVGYFMISLKLLSSFGEGAMIGRYDNYTVDPHLGLLNIFYSILLDPAYVLYQIFTIEKIQFMLLTLAPLAFIPLISKKASRYILIIPYVVINLMSNYVYQHSIDFQYTYGVTGIFFYLVIINLKDLSPIMKKYIVPFIAFSSILLFTMTMSWKLDYISIYRDNKETIKQIDDALALIPKDASVEASGYFVPHLSQRDTLYNQPSKHQYETDYVVFDLRPNRENIKSYDLQLYQLNGYSKVVEIKDVILIMKKVE